MYSLFELVPGTAGRLRPPSRKRTWAEHELAVALGAKAHSGFRTVVGKLLFLSFLRPDI